jgi:hypothetical protein
VQRKSVIALIISTGLGVAACSSPSGSASSSSPGAPSGSPSAVVLAAAHSSAAQASADIRVVATATVDGKNLGIHGSGVVDMAHSAMQLDMTLSGVPALSGSSISTVLLDGTSYVSYPGISTVLPGKSWISQPTSSATTSGVQVSNVSDMLKVLAAKGAVVERVGSDFIGTTPVTAYDVTLSPALIASQGSALGVPASDSTAVQQMLSNGGVTYRVDVDAADQIRQLILHMTIPASSTSPDGQEAIVVDFTNYGTPVSITAPPADQVATVQQFAAAST